MLKAFIKTLIGAFRSKLYQIDADKGVYIGKNCSFKGQRNIILGRNVTVRPYAQIWGGRIKVEKGSEIGERCRFSIANSLEIGEKVLFSPNVYVTDCDHEYRNITVPVLGQGITRNGNKVSIGEGSYIGINSVIVGNVCIGKHCIIGANSVVTKNIPDFSVAVGSPVKVIKKYDFNLDEWVSV